MSIQSVSGNTPAFSPTGGEVKSTGQSAVSASTTRNANVAVTQVAAQTAEKPSVKELRDAVDRIAKFVSQSSSEISFSIDSESGNDVVKVIDSSSKEVIRQIPSEEVVALSRALDKLQGLFVREKI
jgi:flagellar protein FlaG